MELQVDPITGEIVAFVHYYPLADGKTIGASGEKDPKPVVFDGVDYRVRQHTSNADE